MCFVHRKISVSSVVDRLQEGEVEAGRPGWRLPESSLAELVVVVDQGGSSGNGEDRLGLKFLGRSEEKGGVWGDAQGFGPSNWMVGNAVDWDGD